MAFLDKLKFWKKKPEPFSLGHPGDELGLGELPKGGDLPTPEQPLGLGAPRPVEQQPPRPLSGYEPRPGFEPQSKDRDMEIALAKLDTIKAMLDSIDHRLTIIEQQSKSRAKYEYV